ncbi:MAG TPA: polysulfide reductase, partial [Acidimicrobiia bacterium]|nr:polysulfide reductase [Acidimicrobiia bacterium]
TAAAVSAVTGRLRPVGALATASAALMGPAVASYTGALVSDTAIPAWHDAHREMPYLFSASGVVAASGAALLATPVRELGPARRAAMLGALADVGAATLIERRLGATAAPYKEGVGGKYLHAARALTLGGALGASTLGRRSRAVSIISGAALLAGAWCTKMGVFEAGRASAKDPRFTVQPQRERLDAAG